MCLGLRTSPAGTGQLVLRSRVEAQVPGQPTGCARPGQPSRARVNLRKKTLSDQGGAKPMALPSEAHETSNLNGLSLNLGKRCPIESQGVLKLAPKLSEVRRARTP